MAAVFRGDFKTAFLDEAKRRGVNPNVYIIDTDVNNQPSYKILEYNQITEEEYKEKYSKAVNRISTLPSVEEYNKLVQEHNEALKRIDRLEKEVSENAK